MAKLPFKFKNASGNEFQVPRGSRKSQYDIYLEEINDPKRSNTGIDKSGNYVSATKGVKKGKLDAANAETNKQVKENKYRDSIREKHEGPKREQRNKAREQQRLTLESQRKSQHEELVKEASQVSDEKKFDRYMEGKRAEEERRRKSQNINRVEDIDTARTQANQENGFRQQRSREEQVEQRESEHKRKNKTIKNIYSKMEGVVDKEHIGKAYGELSKRPEFNNMSEFDLENRLIQSSQKRHVESKLGDSGYQLSDDMYKEEQKRLQKEIGDRRQASKAQPSQSSTIANVEDEISATLAGTAAPPINSGSSVMNKYMTKKFDRTSADFSEALTGGHLDESAASNFASRFRLGDKSEDFVNHIKGGDWSSARNMVNGHRGNFINTPGTMDKMMGYKVPHMAGGALLTAGLVNSMSSSKGQQSNAQLYGQQQPYY